VISVGIKEDLEKSKMDRERVDGLVRLAKTSRTATELRKTVRALTREVSELRSELALSLGTDKSSSIKIPRMKKSQTGHLTPVCLWSDHHIEELVPLDQTNGLNEYNPEIAERRFEALVHNSVKLIKHEEKRSKISEAVVWLGGDFMSGYIHDDLVEVCSTPPLETASIVHDRLLGGLEFIASKLKADRIYVPTSYGNHGRINFGRPRIATAAAHNLEHAMYRTLARDLKDDDRFVFDVLPTRLKILDLGGFKIRFSHGDDIRYQGGTGGFHAPLVNQVRRWNQETPVNLDCIGHYHTFVDLRFAVINGSLIGHSEYSRKFGFEVPQQVLFFIDRDRNMRAGTYPVWVE
tara:strand:- start:6478 stop:7524 length:1047 start_codon:yes stop_codon:yes gene_type:complete